MGRLPPPFLVELKMFPWCLLAIPLQGLDPLELHSVDAAALCVFAMYHPVYIPSHLHCGCQHLSDHSRDPSGILLMPRATTESIAWCAYWVYRCNSVCDLFSFRFCGFPSLFSLSSVCKGRKENVNPGPNLTTI